MYTKSNNRSTHQVLEVQKVLEREISLRKSGETEGDEKSLWTMTCV